MGAGVERVLGDPEVFRVRIPFANLGAGRTNCYMLHDAGEWLVVDVGAPGVRGRRALVAAFAEAGVDFSACRVFLTHGHFDHAGLLAEAVPARVEALLRRCAPREGEAAERRFLVSGDICLNLKNRKLEMGGEELLLTPKESQIAYLLMSKWPEAVSRDELVRTFWDKTGQYIENNTIRVHMSRLREKLGTYEGNNYVETVRGIGYRWNIPVRSAL